MSDDLTARLRRSMDYSGYFAPLCTEAADRIDALTAENDAWMNGVADAVEPLGFDREAASGPADLLPGLRWLVEARAERDRLREALEQAQPWLHYMLHHIAPDWSSSEAEVLRQDVALVDTVHRPCSTCGGSGKRYPRLTTFDDPCPDCREVS